MRSISNSDSQGRGTDRSETIDEKRDDSHRTNQLFVVGIGPGSPEHLTRRAAHVLTAVEVVAGYSTYIDLIRPLIEGKEIISTGMTKEVARVEGAIEQVSHNITAEIVEDKVSFRDIEQAAIDRVIDAVIGL